ncbi:MAG: glycosyltransferase family 4 protein [Phycisphaerae bacterium]
MRILQVLRRRSFELVLTWDVLERLPIGADGGSSPYLAILSNNPRNAKLAHWCTVTRRHALDSHFICLTDSLREQLIHLGLEDDRVRLIRPPVDLAEIRQENRQRVRSELDLPADARVLLTTCRPGRDEGQYIAAWAAAILHQIWPDLRMILPGGFRGDRRARRLSEECYCPQIFRIAGEHYSPADLLAASDMLVWPDRQSHSTAWLAWAMAAGVPIVATDGPGVRELIRDGQTGFLVGCSQPHALATRIRAAWKDADARRRCVQNAARQADEMFSEEKCLQAYVSLLERLLLSCETRTLRR